MDDVQAKLNEIAVLVEDARAMPMSASCVVNRADLLGLVGDLRQLLPEAFDEAQGVLGDKAAVVEEGRREAEQIIAQAQEDRRELLDNTIVLDTAQAEADKVLADARSAAEAMRVEVEQYVDTRLANFEIVLGKTLAAVERGRLKLSGRHELEVLGEDDAASFLDGPVQG